MASVKQMKATARARAGKGAARAERRAGRVPGVIYGDGKPPLNVSVDHADLKRRIHAGRFLTTIHELDLDGATHRVIPRDFQLDPVKDVPVHVDFLRLGEGARIRVRIPVHVMNADQAPGVRPRQRVGDDGDGVTVTGAPLAHGVDERVAVVGTQRDPHRASVPAAATARRRRQPISGRGPKKPTIRCIRRASSL